MRADRFYTEFNNRMINGWMEGLKHKYGDAVDVRLNWHFSKDVGRKKKNLGVVDFICRSVRNLDVYQDLFSTANFRIRPQRTSESATHNSFKSTTFVAYIKRGMKSNYKPIIESFVRFYAGLFSGTFEFKKHDGSIAKSSKESFDPFFMESVNNVDTKILFVFDGQDVVSVENVMRNTIKEYLGNSDMIIHGRQVICVWCDSDVLCTWKQSMEYEERKAETARLQAENARLKAQKAKLQEEHTQLQSENAILQARKAQLLKVKAQLGDKMDQLVHQPQGITGGKQRQRGDGKGIGRRNKRRCENDERDTS